ARGGFERSRGGKYSCNRISRGLTVFPTFDVRDVSRYCINQLLVRKRNGVPREPPVCTVLGQVSIAKLYELHTGFNLGRRRDRRVAVVRVNEVKIRLRHQLGFGKTEDMPGRAESFEIPVESCNAEHFER